MRGEERRQFVFLHRNDVDIRGGEAPRIAEFDTLLRVRASHPRALWRHRGQ